MATRNVPWI